MHVPAPKADPEDLIKAVAEEVVEKLDLEVLMQIMFFSR